MASTINESADEPITFDELKTGLDILYLIRDGYVKYKDFVATMAMTEDNMINVGIYSEVRDVYSAVTISGKGYNDCVSAVDYAIEKIIAEINKKNGVEVNESLKSDIATGALGLAMLGFASGSIADYPSTKPEYYDQYVLSKEDMEHTERYAKRRREEQSFYVSKEWDGMDPEHEGYVYDKLGDDKNGGTLYIMVRVNEDPYEPPVVRRLGVNSDVFSQYDIGDYIDVYDVIGSIQ
jgi:hypothetical protein